MEKQELCTLYQFAGFNLIKLRGKKYYKKKGDIENNPVFSNEYNFGAVLKNDDLLINIDPQNFKKNDNPASRLKNITGNISTFKVRTGGGGLHIYLKKNKRISIKKKISNFEGVTFLTEGSYVVIAGSLHPKTKKEYVIEEKNPALISDAPSKLLELISKNVVISASPEVIKAEYYDDSSTNVQTYMSFLHTAPKATIPDRENIAIYIITKAKELHLSPVKTYKLLNVFWNKKCQPPFSYQELTQLIFDTYKYKNIENPYYSSQHFKELKNENSEIAFQYNWEKRKDDTIVPCLKNVTNFLKGCDAYFKGLFQFNLFTNNIEFTRKPFWQPDTLDIREWRDSDAINIKNYFSNLISRFENSTNTILEGVYLAAMEKPYHPIKTYLESLVWDGKKRLDTWLIDYCQCNDNIFIREISKKVLVAAVARLYQPGIKFDYLLVLEGEQALYKSTLCNVLGGNWYAEFHMNVRDRDTLDALRGKWIIEIAEMETARKTDIDVLKAFLSRQVDRMRLPYGRSTQDFPRTCIFIGTVNPDGAGYLKDPTGNRRFWIAHVLKIDIEGIRRDRNQLFAEAMIEYKKGCKLFLESPEAQEIAATETRTRQVEDTFLSSIVSFLIKKEEEGKPVLETSINWIGINCFGLSINEITPALAKRIAIVLRMLHYKKEVGVAYGKSVIIYKKQKSKTL
jgi:predicted P-loop ATPase